MKDVNKLSVISQFIQLLHAGGEGQGGMAGLNQFVTFLSQKESMTRLVSIRINYLDFMLLIVKIIIETVCGRIKTIK